MIIEAATSINKRESERQMDKENKENEVQSTEVLCPCCHSSDVDIRACDVIMGCNVCHCIWQQDKRKSNPEIQSIKNLADCVVKATEDLLMPLNKITTPWRHLQTMDISRENLDKLANRQITVENNIRAYKAEHNAEHGREESVCRLRV